ncbi:hypothetical protein [Propionispira arboris]|nr:hypothetical protein [Propionispira arboris]
MPKIKEVDEMACIDFVANSAKDFVKQVVAFLIDPANFAPGMAWQLIRPATLAEFANAAYDQGTGIGGELILKGVGDGEDEIYVGIQVVNKGEQTDIRFNGFAGYDPGLEWFEQPGCIYHATLPIIPLADGTRLNCWVTANPARFILVVQMSTQYESAYIGFVKTVSVERQYPYPLVIGASAYDGVAWSATSDAHSAFMNPGGDGDNTSLRMRRMDGTWRAGQNKGSSPIKGKLCTWPQNTKPTNVLTVLDNSLTIENVIEFPVLLYECDNPGIVGQFDGVYFIGNREDLSAKDTLIHEGKPYKVFNNIFRRDNDEYFAIEWF